MTIDTQKLAADIQRVMELRRLNGALEVERVNRLCNIRHKVNDYDGIIVARNVVDDIAPLFASAPLMADIIRQQGEVIRELVGALDWSRAFIKFHVAPERCVEIGDKVKSALKLYEEQVQALALAAPLVEGK